MFSDKFSVREKYNLLTQEHVATCEQMPVRFTSLEDDRYGPAIDPSIKDKLNLFRHYKPLHVTDPLDDYDNDLFIEYKDGVILSYFFKKFIRYGSISSSQSLWNGFANKVQCPEIIQCQPQILKTCGITNLSETFVNGIEYNGDGSFSSIRVYDTKFDLDDYSGTDFLRTVDRLAVRATNGNHAAASSISLYPEKEKIKYNLNFVYSSFMTNSYKGRNRVPRTFTMYPEQVDMYLETLGETLNILTQDQCDFIKSLCVGNSYFNLTFVVNGSGECENIFVYHHTVDSFKDLTAA